MRNRITLIFFSIAAATIFETQSDTAARAGHIDWASIKPAKDLKYQACFTSDAGIAQAFEYQCARLLLPLDWHNASNTNPITLAVMRRRAAVSETDPTFNGSIIINPGGPGGSGVQFLLGWGEKIRRLVDDEGKRHYEVVSFDPRGVGSSTPSATCFDDPFGETTFRAAYGPDANVGDSDAMLRLHWAAAKGRAKLCEERSAHDKLANGENIREYMGTPEVARDMLELVHKIEEERSSQSLSKASRLEQKPIVKKAPAKLQYMGFSYGTILGTYFASLYPEHIHRMILDANVDPISYTTKRADIPSLEGATTAWEKFYELCYKGQEACAIWRKSDLSPQDIRERVHKLLNQLEEEPMFAYLNNEVHFISRNDLAQAMFQAAYSPLVVYPVMAQLFDNLLNGTVPESFLPLLQKPNQHKACSESVQKPHPVQYISSDANLAVWCGDMTERTNLTLTELYSAISTLKAKYPLFGALWANQLVDCSAWRLTPKYIFSGPFGAPANISDAPILFLNNLYDPVSPIVDARRSESLFPDSVLLRQDSVGHGAVTVPSRCRQEYVRKYWHDGIMPPRDTICAADCEAFEQCENDTAMDLSVFARL
jgi:pimeloyl-ACP methyl ester carboxylesterase